MDVDLKSMAATAAGHARLFVSLDVGALLVIATFLQEPPAISGAKWFVLAAILLFLVSLGLLLWAFDAFTNSAMYAARGDQGKALEEGRRAVAKLRVGVRLFTFGVFVISLLAIRIVMSWP